MQVVSNTSPINYLLQIDGIGILENLNGGSSYRVRSLLNWRTRKAPTSSGIGRHGRQIGSRFGFPLGHWAGNSHTLAPVRRMLSCWLRRLAPMSSSSTSARDRSEEHTSELQSLRHLVCRLLLEKKKKKTAV